MNAEAQSPTTARPKSILDRLSEACKLVAIAGLVVITTVQAWQVFARYVLNNSPGWTEPVSVFFMGMTVMMAAATGVRDETHFAFSNILEALPERLQARVRQVLHGLTCSVGLLLAYWGVQLAILNWDVAMAGAPLPSGIRYLPFAVGSTIMALFALERMIVRKTR